ncbi:MAG: T9SS type A sorting domain-containing protein [Candidatus Krumholzibacteria bacterium]
MRLFPLFFRLFLSCFLFSLFLSTLSPPGAHAKKVEPRVQPRPMAPVIPENLPPDIQRLLPAPRHSSVASDTFHLGWYSFDTGGAPDPQGWTSHDLTEQIDIMFHVADGAELDGGNGGNLLPLEGSQSMWCGMAPNTAAPFCNWATLPGYGHGWAQWLKTGSQTGDSLRISYKVFWDSEPGYDGTALQYSGDGGATWQDLPVGQGLTYRPNIYDGGPLTLVESFTAGGLTSVDLRFAFTSDGAWSDEDGLWPTDGAILLDSITIETFSGGVSNGVRFSNFELESPGDLTDGVWTGTVPAPFGDFAALYPGVAVFQDLDPCFTNLSSLWGFFDDPASTNWACHLPDPRPEQGAVPFGRDGLYIKNEIWSPLIANFGSGNEFRLEVLTYRDLPLDNLLFDTWSVRSWIGGCPGPWLTNQVCCPFINRAWHRTSRDISFLVDPAAEQIQVAVGVADMCGVWCNIFGTGACHSQGPLFDNVHVKRINVVGPRWVIRHLDLFQDNFAEDGTLTGTARADAANDIASTSSSTIQPGDSVTMDITNIGTDAFTGEGPAGYVYVAVWPQGQAGKTGADIEAPETRANLSAAGGKRWPLVASPVLAGTQWYQFRMDTALTAAGAALADRFSIDLNDNLFTPGDTVCYFFGGDDGSGNATYFHRTLNGQGSNHTTDDINEAASSPMEFTILPAGGFLRGGEILYVDDTDDRGGPAQLFFDTAFDLWNRHREFVDRYDVLGPSSGVSNSLGSRVKNVQNQIIAPYRAIIWNSGNLSSTLINDGGWQSGGGSADKSPDFDLIFTFLDQHTDNPGVYYSADDAATDWANVLIGTAAVNTRATYMNFNLDPLAPGGDHKNAGEPISPVLDGVDLWNAGEQLIALGGCPLINDFDLLQATGLSVAAYNNLATGKTYVLSQATPNSAGSTARFVLSGFSFHYIRDVGTPGAVPVRATHLKNIMRFMMSGPPTNPTGFDEPLQFVNGLEPNYPNPFNPTTTIRYSIKERAHVSLRIYNAAGQLVRTLVNEVRTPNPEGLEATWDGRSNAGQSVSSGVYFYRLVTKGFTRTRKMVLLK